MAFSAQPSAFGLMCSKGPMKREEQEELAGGPGQQVGALPLARRGGAQRGNTPGSQAHHYSIALRLLPTSWRAVIA